MTLSDFIDNAGLDDLPGKRQQLAETIRMLRKIIRVPRNWIRYSAYCKTTSRFGDMDVNITLHMFYSEKDTPLVFVHPANGGPFILRFDIQEEPPIWIGLV